MQLDVEGAQAERSAQGFTAIGEGFRQELIEFRSIFQPAFEISCPRLKLCVGQIHKLGFELIDSRHDRAKGFEDLVPLTEQPFPKLHEASHALSILLCA